MSIIYFLIVLGVLVLIHEFGHYIMAVRAGIRVEVFSIGFGPKLFGFRHGETEFKIGLLPLGGFVKMWGEDPEDEHAHGPGSFTEKSVAARTGVVVAGPVMNFLLACLVMPIVFLIGRTEPEFLSQPAVIEQVRAGSPAAVAGVQAGDRVRAVDGASIGTWEELMDAMLLWSGRAVEIRIERGGVERAYTLTIAPDAPRLGKLGIEPPLFIGNEPVIDQVMTGSAAAEGGVQPGDRVLAVNGEVITDWQAMADAIHRQREGPVTLRIQRGGEVTQVTVTPRLNPGLDRYVIGVQKDPQQLAMPTVVRRYGLIGAIVHGEREIGRLARLTVQFLGRLITEPRAHYQSLGGPIQIAQASVSAAKSGLSQLLYFAAFLSLQLGMLNLLPIPVLDGGHVLFLGIEAIRRRPVSQRVRLVTQQVGMVMLLSVLLIVTVNDLDNLIGLRHWFGKLF